jgi:hypothetical protein
MFAMEATAQIQYIYHDAFVWPRYVRCGAFVVGVEVSVGSVED